MQLKRSPHPSHHDPRQQESSRSTPPFGHRPAEYWIDEQVVTNPDLPVRGVGSGAADVPFFCRWIVHVVLSGTFQWVFQATDALVRIPVVQYLRDCGYRVVEAASLGGAPVPSDPCSTPPAADL
jgi:hypothetical protein